MKKDVVLCKDCVYCKYERINTSDEKALLFAGLICQHFSQQVFAGDYCSYGEMTAKIIIVNKAKAGKYLSNEEMEKLKKFASESESKYDELFDYNPEGIVRKAEIIKKIKTGQELLGTEKQELFFIDPFSSLFKDNIVDIIPSKKVRDLFLSDMIVILKFDDELYAIDWEWKRDTYNAIVYWEGTKLYKVRKVKKDGIGVEYEPIES